MANQKGKKESGRKPKGRVREDGTKGVVERKYIGKRTDSDARVPAVEDRLRAAESLDESKMIGGGGTRFKTPPPRR